MSQRLINIGTGPNTKDGDTVRQAFNLVNQNFTELYDLVGHGGTQAIIADVEGSLFADDSSLIVDAINNTITTDQLTVNGTVILNLENGTIRIRGSEPITYGLNPNDAPHVHIEAMDPTSTELFVGDDLQFLRLATDGSIILNARSGSMAPAVVKGADGVLVNNGSEITDINLGNTNVVITVVNHGLVEGDKLYIQDVEGATELNDLSYYATNIDGDNFELLDANSDPILSSNISAWTTGGVIYSATRGGDVIINAGGLDDAYGDEGVVEVYGKTVSITTQTDNTWMFDGVNLTLPSGGDILDSEGNTVLGGGAGTTLPADAVGYLNNDGNGNLSWSTIQSEQYYGTINRIYNIVATYPIISVDPGTNSFVVSGDAVYNVMNNHNTVQDFQYIGYTLALSGPPTHQYGQTTITLDNNEDEVNTNWVGHQLRCVAWIFQPNEISFDTSFTLVNDVLTLSNPFETGDVGFSGNVLYNKTSGDQGLYIAPGGESTSDIFVPGNSQSANTALHIVNTSATGRVYIGAHNNQWSFNADGKITFPDNTIQPTAYRVARTANYNVANGNATMGPFLIGIGSGGNVLIQNFYEYSLTYIISGTKTLSGVTTNIYDQQTIAVDGVGTIDTLANVGDNLQFIMQIPDPGSIYRVTVCVTWSGLPYCSVIIEQLQ